MAIPVYWASLAWVPKAFCPLLINYAELSFGQGQNRTLSALGWLGIKFLNQRNGEAGELKICLLLQNLWLPNWHGV